MSKIVKEIVVITGSYINGQGQQKNRYTTIGAIDGGVPHPQRIRQASGMDNFDDSIPF
mgnify:CR=1 FL=1